MKRSILNVHRLSSVKPVLLIGTFLFAAAVDSNQAFAQSSLPGYGSGYGFTGGVGWGTLPSTPASPGSGYASQLRAGRVPIQSYRVPTQLGNRGYGIRQYGYLPYAQPYGGYGYGYAPYGYGYSPYGVQINAYPGGVIQAYRGPIGW